MLLRSLMYLGISCGGAALRAWETAIDHVALCERGSNRTIEPRKRFVSIPYFSSTERLRLTSGVLSVAVSEVGTRAVSQVGACPPCWVPPGVLVILLKAFYKEDARLKKKRGTLGYWSNLRSEGAARSFGKFRPQAARRPGGRLRDHRRRTGRRCGPPRGRRPRHTSRRRSGS